MGTLFKLVRQLTIPAAIAGFVFVGFGDQFLPQPWKAYSKNTRETINQKLLGVVPDPEIKRPSEGREKLVEDLVK
ncbi:MAG: hypothetical protein ACO36E_13720 [Synechocystis sp.]|jgi:hypothetical protein